MMKKGLIIKIEKNNIIVMSEDHLYERLKVKDHVAVGQKIYYLEEDVMLTKGSHVNRRQFVSIAASIVAVFMLIGVLAFNNMMPLDNSTEVTFEEPISVTLEEPVTDEPIAEVLPDEVVEVTETINIIPLVATVMTIDINPSIKVSLDKNNIVLEVKPLNKDAKTIDFKDLVGFSADLALVEIVSRVTQAGFINDEDDVDDYVLITTVDMDEEDDLNDASDEDGEPKEGSLRALLEAKIAESDVLSKVNVALIKGTKVELRKSEEKEVPLGLLVIQGEITIDGETMKVSEYFSNKDNIDKFEQKGKVIRGNEDKQIEKIERFLQKLEKLENMDLEVISSHRAALLGEGPDLNQIYEDVKALWALYGDDTLEEQVDGEVDVEVEDEPEDDGPKDKADIDKDNSKDKDKDKVKDNNGQGQDKNNK